MNYTCPYCSHHSTLNDSDIHQWWRYIDVNVSSLGSVGVSTLAIVCPNKDCKGLNLSMDLKKATQYETESSIVKESWRLLPASEAKVMPDYIPTSIVEDYYEACKIKDLSPKASATLARRCLQGMIRDFYGISKPTLYEEIKELEQVVDKDTWNSIDAVREVGNIGAHMRKDINFIVEVEPDEAQLLLSLIEQLIDDWYVTRETRRLRSEKLKQLAESKRTKKTGTNDSEK